MSEVVQTKRVLQEAKWQWVDETEARSYHHFDVERLLPGQQFVLIQGAKGCGKTRLARHLAGELARLDGRLRHIVVLSDRPGEWSCLAMEQPQVVVTVLQRITQLEDLLCSVHWAKESINTVSRHRFLVVVDTASEEWALPRCMPSDHVVHVVPSDVLHWCRPNYAFQFCRMVRPPANPSLHTTSFGARVCEEAKALWDAPGYRFVGLRFLNGVLTEQLSLSTLMGTSVKKPRNDRTTVNWRGMEGQMSQLAMDLQGMRKTLELHGYMLERLLHNNNNNNNNNKKKRS